MSTTSLFYLRLVCWLVALLIPSLGQAAEQSFPLGRDAYLWSAPRPSPAPLNFRDTRDSYRSLVQLIDGGLDLQFLDMSLPNGAQPLVVRRAYRSELRSEGVFGKGWTSNLDVRLTLTQAGVPRIVEANGYVTTYESVADHYAPVGGAFPAQELRRWGSNWIRQWGDGTAELFDSYGQLAQRTTTNNTARQYYSSFASKLPSAIVDGKAARNVKLTYRDGLLAQIDFPPGRTIRYLYSQRQLVGTIDPIGRKTAFTYANGKLTALTLPGGSTLTFSYGRSGSLREVSGPRSLGATFAWQTDAAKPIISLRVTDRAGATDVLQVGPTVVGKTAPRMGLQLRRSVDGHEISRAALLDDVAAARGNGQTVRLNDREFRIDGPAGSPVVDVDEWRARFTPAMAASDDAAISRDEAGRAVALRLQDGAHETWKWDNADRIVEWTDDGGIVSHYEYDVADHLVRVKQGDQVTRSASYNELGLLTHLVTADGGETGFTYDANGRLASVGNQTGTRYEFARDSRGRLTTLYLNGKPAKYFTYDDAGRLARVAAAAAGAATEYRYLAHGKQVDELDASGGKTSRLYDEKGRLIEARYPDGGHVSVKYGQGRIVSTTSADGTSALFEYDASGRIQRAQLPGKPERRFTYGKDGRLATISDNNAIVRAFKYDDKGRLLSELDAKKQGSHFAYDNKGRLTSYELGGESARLTYDASGGLSIVERKGKETSELRYDAQRRLAQYRDTAGTETRYEYDAAGLRRITGADGNALDFEHDRKGRLVALHHHANNKVAEKRYQYDKAGRISQVTYEDGSIEKFEHDAGGRPTAKQDRLGNKYTYHYAANGRFDSVDGPFGTERWSYDAQDRMVEHVDPTEGRFRFEYSNDGNQVTTIDPRGGRTRVTLNASGQPVLVEDALGGAIHSEYDAAGHLVGYTDPNGNKTTWEYDSQGRMTQRRAPSGKVYKYKYDRIGNLIETHTPDGVINRQYDASGHLTRVSTNGQAWSYSYDGKSRVTAIDGLGGRETYGYDALDRLIDHKDENAASLHVEYNTAGKPQRVDIPNAGKIDYSYNAAGLLAAVATTSGAIHYSYDSAGRVARIEYPNGTRTTYEYFPGARVRSIGTTDSQGKLLLRESYEYDIGGNVVAVERTGTIGSTAEAQKTLRGTLGRTAYRYDALNRIVEADFPDGSREQFTYDRAGNLTNLVRRTVKADGTAVETSTPYTYDADQALTKVGDSSTSPGPGGGACVERNGSGCAAQYDAFGRLSGWHGQKYDYDSEGRLRGWRDAHGAGGRYLYLGERVLAEIGGKSDAPAHLAVPGIGGSSWAALQVGTDEFFPIRSANGSLLALTDKNAAVVQVCSYRTFSLAATWSVSTPVSGCEFAGGRQIGPGFWFGNRVLADAGTRFMTPDNGGPDKDGNLYSYAFSNPLRFVDRTGTNSVPLHAGLPEEFNPPALIVTRSVPRPWDGKPESALDTLADIARSDPNPMVRVRATELLEGHKTRETVVGVDNAAVVNGRPSSSIMGNGEVGGKKVTLFKQGIAHNTLEHGDQTQIAASALGHEVTHNGQVGTVVTKAHELEAFDNQHVIATAGGEKWYPMLGTKPKAPSLVSNIDQAASYKNYKLGSELPVPDQAAELLKKRITTKEGRLITHANEVGWTTTAREIHTEDGGRTVVTVKPDGTTTVTVPGPGDSSYNFELAQGETAPGPVGKPLNVGSKVEKLREMQASQPALERTATAERVPTPPDTGGGPPHNLDLAPGEAAPVGKPLNVGSKVEKLREARASQTALERAAAAAERAPIASSSEIVETEGTLSRAVNWAREAAEPALEQGAKVANRIEDALVAAEEAGEAILGRAIEHGGRFIAWLAEKPAVRLAKLLGEAGGEVLMAKDILDTTIWAGKKIGELAADIYIATKTHLDEFDDIAKKIAALEDPKKRKARHAELTNRAGPEPLPLHDGIGEPNRPLPGAPAGQSPNANPASNPGPSKAQQRDYSECGPDYQHLVQSLRGGANPPAYCYCYHWRRSGSHPIRLANGRLASEQCAPVLAKLDASDGVSPSPSSSPSYPNAPKPLPAPQPMTGNAPPKPLNPCGIYGLPACPETSQPASVQAQNPPPPPSAAPSPSAPQPDGLAPPNLTQYQEQLDAARQNAPPPAPSPPSAEYQKAMQELDDAQFAEEHARAAAEQRNFHDSLDEHHTPNPPGGIQPKPAMQARNGAGDSSGSGNRGGLYGWATQKIGEVDSQLDRAR